MLSTINHAPEVVYVSEKPRSIPSKFISWANGQQENRLLWLGIALAGHGCVLTPLTLFVVMLNGMHFGLFMTAMVAMGMSLVVNLAALPTRITVPVFLASVAIDLLIMAVAVVG